MRYTEITYFNMIEQKEYVIRVNEVQGKEDFYHHDIVATISGILEARDEDGDQVALITDMKSYI